MDDAPDLIKRLLVVAGMIMEDTVEAALVDEPGSSLDIRIMRVADAGADIMSIASAATTIARRYADPESSVERSAE